MKRKFFGLLFVIGLFLIWGIIGGVDNGEPLSNMLWMLPIALVMWVSARVGRLFEE